jgi:Zn-dependent protease with chaperone function
MHLAILAAVLASLAAAESGSGPVSGLAWRLLVVGCAALVAPLAALVGSWRIGIGNGAERNATEGNATEGNATEGNATEGNATEGVPYSAEDARERSIARLQSLVIGLWISAGLIVLFVARWPQIVRGNCHLAGWPLVDELAILGPVIAPLLFIWAALYRVERSAQVAAFIARDLEPPPAQLGQYLWLHVRHHLGLVLLPALVVVGAFDLLNLLQLTTQQPGIVWWFAAPLLVTLLVLMPLAVRRIWRTTPLAAGELRDRLEAICRQQRCRVREILVWHTEGYMANAAVVGLSRWLRYVLLTDVLLARLTPDEIAAVLRHELAHLRRWHLPLRLALLLAPLAWWLALAQVYPDFEARIHFAVAAAGFPAPLLAALLLPAGMFVYALVVVGWYSRQMEHEADLAACTDDAGRFDPRLAIDFCRALLRLLGRQRESRLGQWLHPPLAARLRFLHSAADGAPAVAPFQRRLVRIQLAIASSYLAALAVALWGMFA